MAVDKWVVEAQLAKLGGFRRFGFGKERDHLHLVIDPGEEILAIASGFYKGNTALIAATNRRLLILDKGLLYGLNQVDFPITQISGVVHTIGLLSGKLLIATSGGQQIIDGIEKNEVVIVANALKNLIYKSQQPVVQVSPPPIAQAISLPVAKAIPPATHDDVISQLERLGALRASGVLSDEEFAQQKAKLLSQ